MRYISYSFLLFLSSPLVVAMESGEKIWRFADKNKSSVLSITHPSLDLMMPYYTPDQPMKAASAVDQRTAVYAEPPELEAVRVCAVRDAVKGNSVDDFKKNKQALEGLSKEALEVIQNTVNVMNRAVKMVTRLQRDELLESALYAISREIFEPEHMSNGEFYFGESASIESFLYVLDTYVAQQDTEYINPGADHHFPCKKYTHPEISVYLSGAFKMLKDISDNHELLMPFQELRATIAKMPGDETKQFLLNEAIRLAGIWSIVQQEIEKRES